MGNLKTALIELNAVSNLQHINLGEQGTLLENSMQEFKDIAAIGEPCIDSCSTIFDPSPTYVLPYAPVPEGTIVFGTPTKGYTALTQPFTYTGTDADSFTAKVDGVSIGTVTSPINLTGLTMGTLYVIEVTPVNTYGTGTPASTSLTTLDWALNQFPTGGTASAGFISFGLANVTAHTITQPFTYSTSDAIGFLFKLNNGSPVSITNPIELESLLEDTVYNLKVAAVTNSGIGQYASVDVKTLKMPLTDALRFLTLEAYYTTHEDLSDISGNYKHLLDFNERVDNWGKFRVTFNDVDVGVINLNNAGGTSHPYNDEYNYPPSPPVMPLGWSGSPYARYSKIELTLEQAQAVEASNYVPDPGYEDHIKINIIPLANNHPNSPATHVIFRATVRQDAETVSNVLIFRMAKTTTFYLQILNVGG